MPLDGGTLIVDTRGRTIPVFMAPLPARPTPGEHIRCRYAVSSLGWLKVGETYSVVTSYAGGELCVRHVGTGAILPFLWEAFRFTTKGAVQ